MKRAIVELVKAEVDREGRFLEKYLKNVCKRYIESEVESRMEKRKSEGDKKDNEDGGSSTTSG